MTESGKSRFVNALTFARVPLIFGWLVFAVAYEYAPGGARGWAFLAAACLMMLVSGLTDAWDGHFARKWNVVSPLGKMSDPLMDKVFYIVAFPGLSWLVMHQGESETHGLAMMSFTILYMLRDTWVTFMRMVGARYGADVAAARLGKVRTALSFPGAGWIYAYCSLHRLAPASWHGPWLWSCFAVEGLLMLLTLWSLVSYTRVYMPYMVRAVRKEGT